MTVMLAGLQPHTPVDDDSDDDFEAAEEDDDDDGAGATIAAEAAAAPSKLSQGNNAAAAAGSQRLAQGAPHHKNKGGAPYEDGPREGITQRREKPPNPKTISFVFDFRKKNCQKNYDFFFLILCDVFLFLKIVFFLK